MICSSSLCKLKQCWLIALLLLVTALMTGCDTFPYVMVENSTGKEATVYVGGGFLAVSCACLFC